MKTISNTQLNNHVRETAFLEINATGHNQSQSLFFVQFDDDYAVGSDGCIYQFIPQGDLSEDCIPLLVYKSTAGHLYNYAEDSADFEADSEDAEIFEHCRTQAELLA